MVKLAFTPLTAARPLAAVLLAVTLAFSGCESHTVTAPAETLPIGLHPAAGAPTVGRATTVASFSSPSTPSSANASVIAARNNRSQQAWQLVSWTSVAGVSRDVSTITYDALMSGQLSPAEVAAASRLTRASDLNLSWNAQGDRTSSTARARPGAPRNAIEFEAAHFPELMRNRQYTREGNQMTVRGPGLLKFEFVKN